MGRETSRAGDSRAVILKAAQEAFAAGDGAVEMGDVARRADVSVGLAYHYFKSKSGLMSAVIVDFYDRYDAEVNQTFERGLSWAAREKERLRRVVAFLYADPLAPVMLRRLSGAPEVMAVEAARREGVIALATVNIAKGQAKGEIDPKIDPATAAAFITGGVRQAMAMTIDAPDRPDVDAFTRASWRVIAGSLGLPPEP